MLPSPASGPKQVLQPALQVTVRIQVVNDPIGHRPQARIEVEPAQLVVQIVLQRLRPLLHVGHGVELPLAHRLDLAPRGVRPLFKMVGPLLVHLHQPLEVAFVRVGLVDHQLALFFGGGIGRLADLRLGLFGGKLRLLFLQLQDRILLHFLLDPLLLAPAPAIAESPSTGSSAAPAPASAPFGGLDRVIVA